MSSATTARHPKGPREPKPDRGVVPFAWAFLDSSVGAKVIVALAGLGLVGFTIIHMIGNLKVFQGPEAINGYAYFLKHDLGVLIWIGRAALLAIFLLHVALAVRLTLRSRAARPVAYTYPSHVQATVTSRTMVWSGIAVGLFILFHLAHFTFGWVKEAEIVFTIQEGGIEVEKKVRHNYLNLTYKMPGGTEVHDVYSMVVAGFTTWWLSLLYIAAQVVLFLHLLHGIPSAFQTLGLKNARFARAIRWLGYATAALILVGNVGIVVGVWAGYAPPLYPTT